MAATVTYPEGFGRGAEGAVVTGNTGSPDIPLLSSAVGTLLGMQGQEFQYKAGVAAQNAAATGAQAEATAYEQAQSIAEQNAAMEGISTKLAQAQTARQVRLTLGAQGAGIAGAGFANSGSALALYRSSARQGALAQQLEGVQGNLTQGGFLAQAVQAGGEAGAANAAVTAANNLGTIYGNAATTTQNNIDAETKALTGYVQSTGATTTPAGQVTLATLMGTTPTNGILKWGQPTIGSGTDFSAGSLGGINNGIPGSTEGQFNLQNPNTTSTTMTSPISEMQVA